MAGKKFNRREKLKSSKAIDALFRTGKSITSPPFRLIYSKTDPLPVPVQMTVAVPKKLIKRAVDRNLLKRRTREAYRLNRDLILAKLKNNKDSYQILFLYQTEEILDYKKIQRSVNFLLYKFSETI